MRPSVTPSLYRCGGVLTRRDPASLNGVTGGLDALRVCGRRYGAEDYATRRQWVKTTLERFGRLEELVNIAGYAIAKLVASDLTVDVETFPRDGLKELGGVTYHPACPLQQRPCRRIRHQMPQRPDDMTAVPSPRGE